uniref:Molybdate transport system substrate-binding protein n=1 Tax=Candidatus Kentrum sp. DK TaxID=2126562 RepID=A0A450RW02_9GAMM|nr:MAG: molybdate transport system substrate-binding protein [Candidatus Kentron sp. DK]
MFSRSSAIALAICCLLLSGKILADTIHVAGASNFINALRQLAESYSKNTAHEFRISTASTGKLFAQIRHGAPFHLFFAADARRPELLVESGDAVADSLSTYAIGRLVLWQPMGAEEILEDQRQETTPTVVSCREIPVSSDVPPETAAAQSGARVPQDDETASCIRDAIAQILTNTSGPLAMANPKTAPYGEAAEETLRSLGLWEALQSRLVRGENIGQTYQFVASGAAPMGFVALSQIRGRTSENHTGKELFWIVPASLHTPMRQQVVLLKSAAAHSAARGFLAFLHTAEAREIIRSQGYGL